MIVPPIADGQREARRVPFAGVEVRAEGGQLTLTGYAIVFDSLSEDLGGFREVVKHGAVRKVLAKEPDVRFMVNHEGPPLARTASGSLRLREDPKGLYFEADLIDNQANRALTASIRRGDLSQMSFRFTVSIEGREWFFPEEAEELPVRIIREFGTLLEISVVTFPAYPATEIGVRSVICGEPIADENGQLDRERFETVCKRVHAGELDASEAERRDLATAAERLETVTPWQRERVLRAADPEPQHDGAEADESGETKESYGLEARRRSLTAIERDFAFATPK